LTALHRKERLVHRVGVALLILQLLAQSLDVFNVVSVNVIKGIFVLRNRHLTYLEDRRLALFKFMKLVLFCLEDLVLWVVLGRYHVGTLESHRIGIVVHKGIHVWMLKRAEVMVFI